MTLQDILLALSRYWAKRGCLLHQPWDVEVGAGTMNPATFLRVLGPEPWRAAYLEPTKRPKDGRYAENPNRVQQFNQYQVILKPPPADIQEQYLRSLVALGIDPARHDVRFEEDNWESPTLGAWGIGWQVLLDGQEITQFTYFQQAGGMECDPVSAEITYGLERICMYLQGVDDIMDVEWGEGVSWGDLNREAEKEFSRFNFEKADVQFHFEMFERLQREAVRMLGEGLILPAYDYVVKCSHIFNILDARGAVSVSERTSYIARLRDLARQTAEAYVADRKRLGFPLMARRRAFAKERP
ncbi:MAG TPA: glycine--tRNA ligase subunit alpha [Candidatus Bathyarchaeia archaeon]|nr:glycine--tRNA ligase subunit alpha [Candidatus Bathyarchaeia archaeon]